MGAGSSAAEARLAAVAASAAPPVTPLQLSLLSPGYPRADDVMVFPCIPEDGGLRTRCPVLLLEVSAEGFRLLRPSSDDALCGYSWGQIHSWAHTDNRFTFRYFDDGKRAIQEYNLHPNSVESVLERVQVVIDGILHERKGSALTESKFLALCEVLKAAPPGGDADGVEVIRAAVSGAYVLAEQGKQLLDLLPTNFDKVEAAVLLHGRLVDQNRFAVILERLDCPEDRNNVWHRITALKKQSTRLSSRRHAVEASSASASEAAAKSGPLAREPSGAQQLP